MGWKTVSLPAKKPPDPYQDGATNCEAWLSHGLSVATVFHWSYTFNTDFVFACCLFSILYRHCDSFPVEQNPCEYKHKKMVMTSVPSSV